MSAGRCKQRSFGCQLKAIMCLLLMLLGNDAFSACKERGIRCYDSPSTQTVFSAGVELSDNRTFWEECFTGHRVDCSSINETFGFSTVLKGCADADCTSIHSDRELTPQVVRCLYTGLCKSKDQGDTWVVAVGFATAFVLVAGFFYCMRKKNRDTLPLN